MKTRFFKSLIIVISSFMLIAATGFQSVQALDKSRFFTWLMFSAGLGASATGAIMQNQANETYDQYLHTAVQADMNRLIDDYDSKHQQSIIVSKAGVGLVIGAIIVSLIDAAHIPSSEIHETSGFLGYDGDSGERIISAHTQNGEFLFTLGRKF